MTPNTHPAEGFRSFEDVYKRACEILGRDPSTKQPIEFDVTDAEFMSAYFKIHHIIEEDGIDFWWLDWQVSQTKFALALSVPLISFRSKATSPERQESTPFGF